MKKNKRTHQKKTYAGSGKEFIETLEAAIAKFHKAQISWHRRNSVPITKVNHGTKRQGR
jgi:ADP-ribosylglycohydrolase